MKRRTDKKKARRKKRKAPPLHETAHAQLADELLGMLKKAYEEGSATLDIGVGVPGEELVDMRILVRPPDAADLMESTISMVEEALDKEGQQLCAALDLAAYEGQPHVDVGSTPLKILVLPARLGDCVVEACEEIRAGLEEEEALESAQASA